jgi:hypothetical protein
METPESLVETSCAGHGREKPGHQVFLSAGISTSHSSHQIADLLSFLLP